MAMTREAVIQMIADESGIERDKLKAEATLMDLDISSIDLASAAFALEEEFGIEIEPENISREATLGEFVDHVMSLRDT